MQNQAVIEAREKLAALPKWVKLMIGVQGLLCTTMLFWFYMMLANWGQQYTAVHDDADAAVKAYLLQAFEIGSGSWLWTFGLLFSITASILLGLALMYLTPPRPLRPKADSSSA